MKKLIWNTHKNSQSFWGEYHHNASRNWIFYLLEKIKYKILEDLKKFMSDPKNAARMNEAGLIRESSKITFCSD